MKLNLIDIDEFCKDLPEITNPKIIENRKFSAEGLFSQQIFGPTKSYHCGCSRNSFKGPKYEYPICTKCGVEITTRDERKKRYAKIELPFSVLNPIYYYMITSNKPSLKRIVDDLIYYKAVYWRETEEDTFTKFKMDDIDLPENGELLKGLDGAKKLMYNIAKEQDREDYSYVLNNIDSLGIKNILVIPPDHRPCGKINKKEEYMADDVNLHYQTIVKICNALKVSPIPLTEDNDLYINNFAYLQFIVLKLYDFVLKRMSKKSGLIRSNILGKRVDFSGRAVISPNPELKIDECGIPYWMILEILKPNIIAYMINRHICKRYNQASKIIDECLRSKDESLLEIVSDFCNGKICVLNRQPTLHRLGILAFKVKVHLGKTIQIHPMVCPPYNADFDGDAMALYFPISDEAVKDVEKHLLIDKNLISPTDIEIVPKPNQDIILGVYTLTKDEGVDGEPSIGRIIFNKCLPDNYPFIDKPVSGALIKTILNNIVLFYPKEEVLETIDKIKEIGFMYSTMEGFSLGIDDLYSEELEDYADSFLTGVMEEDMVNIKKDEHLNSLLKKQSYSEYIESGARGSWDQAKQMVFSKGYVSDANGIVRKDLIKSSYITGLDQEEFFNSCWGSRKGLLDTAVSTGDSGYLTRQLIYSTCTTVLDKETNDCGTKDVLTIKIENKKMAKSVLWRYMVENGKTKLITHEDVDELVGKTINLRSPVYCKNPKICKTCYGNLHKILHSDQIGVIATQAIGERATQLVLRTFHFSGTAKDVSKEGKNKDIISGMDKAKKLFHNPDSEDIYDPEIMVKELFTLFSDHGKIHLVHFETVAASMMWVDNEKWRLMKDRDEYPFEWVSILQVPSRSSWLLACAFSNLKQKILSGIVSNKSDYESSITKLFRY